MPTSKRKIENQPKLKLYYFNIAGKGEPIRLLAAFSGLEMEDFRITNRDELAKMKESGKLAFGQVPLLEVDGKYHLVQSAAILRYMSKLASLYPEDPVAAAGVDAALDQEADAFMGPTVVTYTARFGIELDDAAKARAAELIGTEVMPRHLENLERLLSASPTGWIAGTEEPSPADFAWACRLRDYIPKQEVLFPERVRGLEDFPKCREFVDRFYSLPAIKEYYDKKQGDTAA